MRVFRKGDLKTMNSSPFKRRKFITVAAEAAGLFCAGPLFAADRKNARAAKDKPAVASATEMHYSLRCVANLINQFSMPAESFNPEGPRKIALAICDVVCARSAPRKMHAVPYGVWPGT